ncbi:hypothetical protein ES705_09357 [subsurface metagenome]
MTKVWVVPYAWNGSLQGVEVFDDYEKAKGFVDELKVEHSKEERLDFFIRCVNKTKEKQMGQTVDEIMRAYGEVPIEDRTRNINVIYQLRFLQNIASTLERIEKQLGGK